MRKGRAINLEALILAPVVPAVRDLRTLFNAALAGASADAAMPKTFPVATHGRTLVIAVGKAAAAMMRVAQARAPVPLSGLIVTRYDHLPADFAGWPGVEVVEAGHPVPDANSLFAAERALALAGSLDAGDRLLVLLSGGGSALLAAPAPGVDLGAKQELTRALLRSGATIGEINCVRKHLSAIKGGRLAVAAGAAQVTTWIISDVPGDDPSFVSSGPTVADATTLADARAIIEEYGVDTPPAVAAALSDAANETPAGDSLGIAGSETVIIARARDAIVAAARVAGELGYKVTDLGDQLQAEARYLGASHAALARRLGRDGNRRVILSGGEATVTVVNKAGRGGRNLEYLLGLAIALDGQASIYALACDTDGIDGTEAAAGAVITPDTLRRARALGLDPAAMLAANNAYDFFEALGDLVVTGPTLTNVNDFRAIIIDA
jgi:glycerate 2-kinase